MSAFNCLLIESVKVVIGIFNKTLVEGPFPYILELSRSFVFTPLLGDGPQFIKTCSFVMLAEPAPAARSSRVSFIRGTDPLEDSPDFHQPHADGCSLPEDALTTSAASRLIGEVVQSRRRPLLGLSPV